MTLEPGLDVQGLTVRFGGLVAVSDLSFSAPVGAITALIGPNGAGKTTTFEACTGLVSPSSGTVRLFDRDATRMSPAERGRLGVARTFQRMQLFESLTVAENVALGREAALAGRGKVRHLMSTRAETAEIRGTATELLTRFGLLGVADRLVVSLPTGVRRLVEVARALAAAPRLLLLDEPSSGLDDAATRELADILAAERRDRGTGILLVEHDMAFVSTLCERAYVLDFGKLIFAGSLQEALDSPVVRDAYLGQELVG
jgi:ABC-type branched-subunit amino acid transport system ATPase component